MINLTYDDLVKENLLVGAIENNLCKGHLEDYHILHCLLKFHKPQIFLEIGTNVGTGTEIIKNALGPDSVVYSLDLPTELAHLTKQHPISEGKGDVVGSSCKLPFIQLRGNSLIFNYSEYYPINGWFIDGEHEYGFAYHESKEAIKSQANIIIWHDADITEVYNAIIDALGNNKDYLLFRVTDTRIAYALKNKSI